MVNSLLDQINAHIEKNTFFSRQRFSKREEETISEGYICINCETLLKSDICENCGFSFDRKFQFEKK